VLAGNPAVARFRARGARRAAGRAAPCRFRLCRSGHGERWTLRINDGPVPWWVLVPGRRVPGSRLADYLPLARLLKGRADQTIGEVIATKAGVGTDAAPGAAGRAQHRSCRSSAGLTAAVLAETLAKGGKASAPRMAVPDLASAFIDPAVTWLGQHGVPLACGRRLKAIRFAGDAWRRWNGPMASRRWRRHRRGAGRARLGGRRAGAGAVVPDDHRSILNAHFALPRRRARRRCWGCWDRPANGCSPIPIAFP
jgi:hypothetical protein